MTPTHPLNRPLRCVPPPKCNLKIGSVNGIILKTEALTIYGIPVFSLSSLSAANSLMCESREIQPVETDSMGGESPQITIAPTDERVRTPS